MTSSLRIVNILDEHQCDLCGYTYSHGYKVYKNDKLELDLEPVAHCYNSTNYTEEDLITALGKLYDYKVSFEDEYT